MKLIFLIILALIIASGLAYQVHLEPGYALLTYGQLSIETSLAVLLFITLISFFGFYFFLRTLLTVKRTPKTIGQWNQKRKLTRSKKELNKGLIDSAEGHWQRSEKLLIKHAQQSETPLLNYLSAAHAAQSQDAFQRRDDYLFKAGEALPDQLHAIQLTRAKLQLAAGQLEQALATLQQLKAATPNHPIVLTLLMKTYQQLNEWDALYNLLPALKSNRKISRDEWQSVKKHTLIQLLKTPNSSSQHELDHVWASLDKKQTTHPDFLIPYATQLINSGKTDVAETCLIKGLNAQSNADLLALYMTLNIPADKKQQQLEKWQRKQTTDPTLLNALAQLCMEQEKWAPAKQYLEESLSLQPSGLTYLLLGQTQEHIEGTSEKANTYYKKGLELSLNATSLNATQNS